MSGGDDMNNLIQISECVVDLSDDHQVNGADYAQKLSVWNTSDAASDSDGDGVVNGADLAAMLANWGRARQRRAVMNSPIAGFERAVPPPRLAILLA